MKPWYKSKTLWFNAAVASLAALEATFSVFNGIIPGNIYAYLSAILAVGNAILRVISSQAIIGKATNERESSTDS